MHVTRIGLAPLKGTRHVDLSTVELTPRGPVGDRVFALVDLERRRLLRTVENRSLMATTAHWGDGLLRVDLPQESVQGEPEPTGGMLEVDYWGRPALVELVEGPWAAAYSRHLGRTVALARAGGPGQVVYGAPVSLVTSSSLARVSHEVAGRAAVDPGPVEGTQFRATLTVDTTGWPDHVEDGWLGHRLRLGEAEVEVRSAIPRCAVVDLDPRTGGRRHDVLAALAGYRRAGNEVLFGVDAVVTRPGSVGVDDVVERV